MEFCRRESTTDSDVFQPLHCTCKLCLDSFQTLFCSFHISLRVTMQLPKLHHFVLALMESVGQNFNLALDDFHLHILRQAGDGRSVRSLMIGSRLHNKICPLTLHRVHIPLKMVQYTLREYLLSKQMYSTITVPMLHPCPIHVLALTWFRSARTSCSCFSASFNVHLNLHISVSSCFALSRDCSLDDSASWA